MNRAGHVGGMVWFAALFSVSLGLSPLLGGLAGALWLAVLAARGKKSPLWSWTSAVALCVACFSLVCYNAVEIFPARRYENTWQSLRGVVIEIVDRGSYAVLTLKNDPAYVPSGLGGTRVRLTTNAGLDVALGDVVDYKVQLLTDPKKRASLYAAGLRFEAQTYEPLGRAGTNLRDMDVVLARYRDKLAASIKRSLPGDECATLTGMLLGRTEDIPQSLRTAYARAGISHLLSVSGLHLAILTALLDGILCNLYLSRRARGLLKMLAIMAFIALTGFSSSIVRAGVMMLLCASAELFGRDNDGLNSLGFALIFILLMNPYAAFGLSLQLSYLATMGVCALASPMTDWACRRIWKQPSYLLALTHGWQITLLRGGCTTIAACTMTAPLICWYFGEISIVSPIVNLLIAPLEPIALGCGLLLGFTGLFPSLVLLTRTLGLASGVAVKQINQTAVQWAELRLAALPVQSGSVILWLCGVLALGIMMWLCHATASQKRYAMALAGIILMITSLAHAALWHGSIAIAVPNSGDVVAVAYGKQGAVIGAPRSVYAARNVEGFFNSCGVDTIELFVVEENDAFYSNASALLIERFGVQNQIALDETDGFSADLFGLVHVYAAENRAKSVNLDIGGLRMVKAFVQKEMPADLLVNGRNELIAAPYLKLRSNTRYFNSTVFSVRIHPKK